MIECNCGNSIPVETQEHVVCSNCGVILDKLYEKELSHKQVSHFANPIIGDIHPTINRTLSELSILVDMKTKTRLDIIDRAYQLYDSTINYAIATKFAFMEQFPEIELDFNKKTIKKVVTIERNHTVCSAECHVNCAKTYRNNNIIKKINKLKSIVKNGRKKGKNIDDILTSVKFSKTKYYKYRNYSFTHKKVQTKYDIYQQLLTEEEDELIREKKQIKKIITKEISNYITSHETLTLTELQEHIRQIFKKSPHISSIARHRKKMKNASN